MKYRRPWLCRLGLHRVFSTTRHVPSIDARVVTDVFYFARCNRCGEVLANEHQIWNGTQFVTEDLLTHTRD